MILNKFQARWHRALMAGRCPGWGRFFRVKGGWTWLLVLAVPLLSGCPDNEVAQIPLLRASPRVNLVVVGDSLSAGSQNSCLVDHQQVNGYANVIARQARWELNLPLISTPGAPPCLDIFQTGNPLTIGPVADPADPGNWGVRTQPGLQPDNLAVPGARVVDVINAFPDTGFFDLLGYPMALLHNLVLNTPEKSPPLSMLDQAEMLINASAKDRDVAILWLGSNDALWAAIGGNPLLLTPKAAFEAVYGLAISRLAVTGAKLVVANIPPVTVIPHLWRAENAAALFGVTLDTPVAPGLTVGALLGIASGDYVTFGGLNEMFLVLTGQIAGPLSPNSVLDAGELVVIEAAIADFNATIAAQAQAYGAVLVDINALLADVHANGYLVDGTKITTDFCGGVFTLDGIHPTNTGYAVTANTFIEAMNAGFNLKIPLVDLAPVLAAEPLKHFCVAGV